VVAIIQLMGDRCGIEEHSRSNLGLTIPCYFYLTSSSGLIFGGLILGGVVSMGSIICLVAGLGAE